MRMGWAGRVGTHGGEEECTRGFDEEGKTSVLSPRVSWEDNIKIDLRRI
jgi:hypothetical protein